MRGAGRDRGIGALATARTPPLRSASTPEPVAWHALPGLDAARALHVDAASGLSADEAARRLADLGRNVLVHTSPPAFPGRFAERYADPVAFVLLAAGFGSVALGEVAAGLALLALTVVNALLWLWRAGPSPADATALERLLLAHARVRRDGVRREVAAAELVAGDVVLVEAGDVVPADGRLLDATTLELDESMLTGER